MNKFIVSGVPRSGTTALASLLNWHPAVFCGIERFPLESVDQSYFTREMVNDKSIPTAHFETNRDTLKEKAQLEAIGDKGPRYFYRLAGSENIFSDTRLIFIIRDIAEVFQSWNSRATNPDDRSWHRGQTGIFSYLDYLQLLHTFNEIQSNHDSIVLSYEQLFYGDPARQHQVIDQLFDFIGAKRSSLVHANFDAESDKRQSLKKKQVNLDAEEYEFLDLVRIKALFSTLEAHRGVTSPRELKSLSAALLDDFHARSHEILTAIDRLLLPQTGISQAMTAMRLCYRLSAGNNIYAGIETEADDMASFELLANMFNATQQGRHQNAFNAGEQLLDRFPDCPELLVEMSMISDRMHDKTKSILYTRKAMDLQPGNNALFSRLKHLIGKR